MALVDVVFGAASRWIALWWRRRWPVGGGRRSRSRSSAFSAFVAGAGLIALFNVALRGSRRALIVDDRARPDGGGDLSR